MIVTYSPATGTRLDEAEDFRKFKVLLQNCPTAQPEIRGIGFVDDGNALVGIDLVPTLPGAPKGPEWRAGYDAMVKAAAKYGWIDEASQSIKAHVERQP
ncbi:hypothetical protein [Gemmobacter sp.]|uniref:hypothetical protein n=1 Tax=Gemmobacter sp. TaxID=1898957 RepID=UPI002AFE6C34|nr:hypothetical protein [Gemmobacter sp.]